MREVDQALERVYGTRRSAEPASLPPAPHFPVTPAAVGESNHALEPPAERSVTLRWPETVCALERDHGERFERLAELLIEARQQRPAKVLLFTSCHRAEGRTTLVMTLAKALARRPGRTILVDADLSGPMHARLLGLRPSAGLDDVVAGSMNLTEAVIEVPGDHLALLPMRVAVARPREFLASPGWSLTLARLRREFDTVLLDGSPLFAGLSAAVLHRSVDAAVLVFHRALTSERTLLRAREVLNAGGVPLLGLAETFV